VTPSTRRASRRSDTFNPWKFGSVRIAPELRFRAGALLALALTVTARPTLVFAADAPEPAPNEEIDSERAREVKDLTRAGIAQYRKGNLDEARAQFAKAWALKQTMELAASLAEVEMRLQRFADAAEHWEYYIQHLPPDRTDAEFQLAECRKHLGSVRVAVDTPGAVVSLDGEVLGPAPVRRDIWVNPGAHLFQARGHDGKLATQQISIASGEAQMVTLMLGAGAPTDAGPAPAVAASEPPRTGADASGLSTKTLVILGGSALSLGAMGVGVGFTLKAGAAANDADALRAQIAAAGDPSLAGEGAYCSPPPGERPSQCDAYSAKLDDEENARNVALASFVTGGVLAVGTVVTALLWPAQAAKTGHAPRVTFTASSRGGTLFLESAF
jgi:tetratricopeptide (TPR) repeat protein